MMHGREKSDSSIVAEKPANKPERPGAEPAERRGEAEGNAGQQSTHRTPGRAGAGNACSRRWPAYAKPLAGIRPCG